MPTTKKKKETSKLPAIKFNDIVELYTWVVAALRERPSREQRPSPAATDRAISSTPASPTAPWDLVQSHLSMVKQA